MLRRGEAEVEQRGEGHRVLNNNNTIMECQTSESLSSSYDRFPSYYHSATE